MSGLVGVGWWRAGTGLTRVAAEILPRLAERRPVDYVGLGHRGLSLERGNLRVHACDFEHRDAFGAHATAALVQELRPSTVLVFNDLWFLDRYRRVLNPVLDGARLVAYLPLDGELPDAELVRPLLGYDLVIVYTEWAREQLLHAFAALAAEEDLGGSTPPQVGVVGHGLDADTFQPAPELLAADFDLRGRTAAKRRLFPTLPDPERSFVVLNASRPSKRKRIDLTLAGFARFLHRLPAEDRDHVHLCLHQAVTAEVRQSALEQQIDELGLRDRILGHPFGSGPIDDSQLNDLYNACDVGLNTSTGEGWGLVSFEHAAGGGRQIVPDHSACAELWRDHGILLPIQRSAVFDYSPLRLAETSPPAVAEALHSAYDQRSGEGLAEAAQWAAGPQFRWERLAGDFEELIGEADDTAESGGRPTSQPAVAAV